MQPVLSELLNGIDEGLPAFRDYLLMTRAVSDNTYRAYQADIVRFVDWLQGWVGQQSERVISRNKASDMTRWMYEMTTAYTGFLRQTKLSSSSISRHLSALGTFFRFLGKHRYVNRRWLPSQLQRPRQPKHLPDFIPYPDLERWLKRLKKSENSPLMRRNIAIVQVLFTSGVRVSELTGLTFDTLHLDQGDIKVLGKGGRERMAFLSESAMQDIREYVTDWHELAKADKTPFYTASLSKKKAFPGKSPVFISHTGTALSARSVGRMLTELAKKGKLGREIHPHLFRHSFATHLLNQGVDLRLVQELLGHVSIRSTQVYTHLTTERLKQVYLSAHPRAR